METRLQQAQQTEALQGGIFDDADEDMVAVEKKPSKPMNKANVCKFLPYVFLRKTA